MKLLFIFERKFLSENIFDIVSQSNIFIFDICFNAYGIFDFFSITFHTLPKPPLPIIYLNSKSEVETIYNYYFFVTFLVFF